MKDVAAQTVMLMVSADGGRTFNSAQACSDTHPIEVCWGSFGSFVDTTGVLCWICGVNFTCGCQIQMLRDLWRFLKNPQHRASCACGFDLFARWNLFHFVSVLAVHVLLEC